MENNDLRVMFEILEWEIEEKLKRLEKQKVLGSKQVWKTKKEVYSEMLEMVRNITKGAV
jgi:hypothetical protein